MSAGNETERAALAPAAAPSHAEVLLRSACDTLCHTPSNLISAMSLSLPDPNHTGSELADIALNIAIEYGLLADIKPAGNHVHVRLTRRVPAPAANGNHNTDPIFGRERRKGRN